ncbi:MAG: YciI family protein [Nitrospira sp.]|nr:YciI family protein [Nitrospira sp.]
MKYLLLVRHNEEAFNKIPEDQRKEMLAESIQLCYQLNGKGQYIHASPLRPEATGTIVQIRDSKAIITDGPFMETKEQLAGYFLVDTQNQEEAIEIAKQIPGARIGTVEVRPVVEISGLPNE